MKTIYLDYNATSPIRPEVLEAMMPYLKDDFGNPSSLYLVGQRARKAVEGARAKIAEFIGARDPDEIVFTSGGTEADNLAIKGAALGNIRKAKRIVISAIEHSAVREAASFLRKVDSFQVVEKPVEPSGAIDPDDFDEFLTPDTTLVSIMAVNNETGVIQPVDKFSPGLRRKGILFHTDAVQAAGRIKIDVDGWGADLLTLSGHKFGAPKSVGILYVRKGTRMEGLIQGGSQEKNRRGGTENVAAIVGMGVAADLAKKELEKESIRIQKMRDNLEGTLLSRIPNSFVNGAGAKRVANTTNICFEYTESSKMIMALDLKGVSASNGSACASGNPNPSHVLLAMGLPQDKAHASMRFSLGHSNTEEEIKKAAEIIVQTVSEVRATNPLWKEKALL